MSPADSSNSAILPVVSRLQHVDIAKGVAILCVVLGHSPLLTRDGGVYRWIYSFHVPLFFFLSGVFASESDTFLRLLKKRFWALLVPSFTLVFAGMALSDIALFVLPEASRHHFPLSASIISATTGLSFLGKEPHLWPANTWPFTPLWFAYSLFATSLAGAILIKRKVNPVTSLLVLFAGLVLSFKALQPLHRMFFLSIDDFPGLGLPFRGDLLLGTLFYYLMGFHSRKAVARFESQPNSLFSIFITIVLALSSMLLAIRFPARIDIHLAVFNNIPFALIGSLIGIIAILACAKAIRGHRIGRGLAALGRESFWILAFHTLAFTAVEALLGVLPQRPWAAFTSALIASLISFALARPGRFVFQDLPRRLLARTGLCQALLS